MVVNALPSVRTIGTRIRRRGLAGALTRGVQRALRIPLLLLSTFVLRRRIREVASVEQAVDLAYDFSFAGVVFGPWQERSEIEGFLTMADGLQPRTILEIGTSNGGSLFLFARVAAPDALLVSVDLPHGEFGGGYPTWRGRLYRAFASAGQRIKLLRADSHSPDTLEIVRSALEGRPVDVLFIDGDHTYDGVKQDFETYGSLVRDGGIVGFHDIVPTGPDGPKPRNDDDLQGGEVPAYWAELREKHEVVEFVDDWGSGRFGIGAIRLSRTENAS